jgi:hypothetical protein
MSRFTVHGLLFTLFALFQPSPPQTFSIRHYDLLIKPDLASKHLSVTATIDIVNPGLDSSFLFGLNSSYESVTVTCNESPLVLERTGGWITATAKEPVAAMQLRFELQGKPGMSNDEKRGVIEDSSLFLLWSDRFYPIDFERWATVRTEVLLPSGFQAIAPGRLTKTEQADGGQRIVFESSGPAVMFSVFADRRWIRTEREINGLRMQTLLYPESQEFADQIFRTSSEVIGYFSSLLHPYPFEQFSFITISGMFARRAFPGFVGYAPHYLAKEFTTTGHDAHETSLLWWGYTTRGRGPGSFQWTEGFGDYVEIMYDEAFNKPIPANFRRFREQYLAMPAEEDVAYTELRGNTPQKIVHGKYPWLMKVIRDAVGDTAFVRALKLLFERYRFRTFTMDEFIAVLEEGTGRELEWWRKEWLERKKQ